MGSRTGRRRAGAALSALGCALLPCVLAAPAVADSTVTVGAQCTLPDAVAYADGGPEPGCASGTASGTTTINLPASASPYTITSTLNITAPTIIEGASASNTAISGGGTVEVLDNTSSLNLEDVTITDGESSDATTGCTGSGHTLQCPAENGNPGGAISNTGTLMLTDSVVSDSTAAAAIGPVGFNICEVIGCQGTDGAAGGNGGGIYNGGTLTITDSTITDNRAGAGGDGTAGITASGGGPGEQGGTAGPGGSGGGIYNAGPLSISGSTISDNYAGAGGEGGAGSTSTTSGDPGGDAGSGEEGGSGGAIFSQTGYTISNSTISGDESGAGGNGAGGGDGDGAASGSSSAGGEGGAGGGIGATVSSNSSITNVTMSGNDALQGGTNGNGEGTALGGQGGAIRQKYETLALTFVTIADNTASGGEGAISLAGLATEANSIIASNSGTPQCTTGITDQGGDIDFADPSPGSCPGSNTNPDLGALANNGGPTETMALGAGSAAIGLVPLSSCSPGTDQRGVARPQVGECDAGAYEFAPPTVAAFSVKSRSPTTAAVTASIAPNLSAQDTTVSVKYGKTTAFGSSTAAQNIGDGDAPAPFTATLTRLRGGTTYHVELVATNGDGTTTDVLGTVKTANYPTIKARVKFTFAFSRRSTQVERLKVIHVPKGARVKLICRGHGCPFRHRTFKVKHGSATATSAFKHHYLVPHATIEVEVTAVGEVGYVETFTIRSGSLPAIAHDCLAPGASKPTRCT